MSSEFQWTASFEARYQLPVIDFRFFPFAILDNELKGRVPVYKFSKAEPELFIAIGIEDEHKEDATHNARQLVQQALGKTGLAFSEIEMIAITPNEWIDQDISRINPYTGTMAPEATILEFPKRQE
jgi:hypothetical protein